MIAPEGKNGKPHSQNGSHPGKELSGPQVELILCDRLDALERALGTVRRRKMTLKVFSVARHGSDEIVLTLRGDEGVVLPDRWIAELGALVDVRQVKVGE